MHPAPHSRLAEGYLPETKVWECQTQTVGQMTYIFATEEHINQLHLERRAPIVLGPVTYMRTEGQSLMEATEPHRLPPSYRRDKVQFITRAGTYMAHGKAILALGHLWPSSRPLIVPGLIQAKDTVANGVSYEPPG